MKIRWEIEDGYVGKSRPHYLEINDEDLEGYEDEFDRNDFIYECIQEDFYNKCGFTWNIVE